MAQRILAGLAVTMIIDEIRHIKSGKKDLWKFGITMGIVLGVLGVLFLWRGRGFYFLFFILFAFDGADDLF